MRRRHVLGSVLLLAGACIAKSGSSHATSPSAGPAATATAASPSAAVEGQGVMDDAIAGALVHAISMHFGGRTVDMRLDAVEVLSVGGVNRDVNGTGRLRLDGGDDWMGFRFHVLYDSRSRSAGDPQVSIGGVAAGERDIPNDVQLVQQLEDRVAGALCKELRLSRARLRLDRISTVEAGKRFLRINATGLADFGPDGSADTQIEGFYDLTRGAWVRVHYDVGNDGGSERLSWDVPLAKTVTCAGPHTDVDARGVRHPARPAAD